MNHWLRSVVNILENNNVSIWLKSTYVDDVRWLINKITRGLKYEKECKLLIYDPAYELKYQNLNDTEYSAMVLKDIMNDIVSDMSFTTETQFDFSNQLLPTLDFNMKLTYTGDYPTMYYAMAENVKTNTITQETIRRLSNTCGGASQQRIDEILDNYTDS